MIIDFFIFLVYDIRMPPKTDSYVMQNFFRRLLQDIAPGITVKYIIVRVLSPELLSIHNSYLFAHHVTAVCLRWKRDVTLVCDSSLTCENVLEGSR